MSNNLINVGELAKPASLLVEKISEAIGGLAHPWQIVRVATAQAKADIIEAKAKIEISELEERALQRLVAEEGIKQRNIESIAEQAFPLLEDNAPVRDVSRDWLAHFFERAKLTSEVELQQIWAHILAGEANAPKSFSKRTLDFVATLDRHDAELFTSFCSTTWNFGALQPLIFDITAPENSGLQVNFEALQHLEDIGLISLVPVGAYTRSNLRRKVLLHYYGEPLGLMLPLEEHNTLVTGCAKLSEVGAQLTKVCNSKPDREHFESVIRRWIDAGLQPHEPLSASATRMRMRGWY